MKKIFTLLMAAGLATGLGAQTITVSSVDETLANDYAGGCEIDLDNDGIKELIVSGRPAWEAAGTTILVDAEGNEYEVDRKAWLFKWNGQDYTKTNLTEAHQLFGIRGTVIPADFNGDGNVDYFAAGEAYDYTGVYLNDGKGGFTKDPAYAVLDKEGNQVEWYPRSADVADFNGDGRPDIVTIGWSAVGGNRQANCGVLINQGDGTFKNAIETGLIGNGEVDYEFALCTVKAFDLNNDGKADFLVQGNVDNDGRSLDRTFMAFCNLSEGDEIGFYDLELATSVSHQFGNGNFAVVDFNNDGTPDIFVTGESPNDAVEGWAYFPQMLYGKISGEDVSYQENTSFVAAHKDIRPLNSNNVGVRAIDYNADGYYDLFLDGWCEQMLDGTGNTQPGYFLPGSAAGLISYQRIPGASEQGIFFLDYGVTGALNYAFTGYHGDGLYFQEGTDTPNGRSMVFTKNPWQVAARPDAPTAPTAEIKGNTVKLSWTPAASSLKNVTYEIYIKDLKTGRFYNGVTSFVGGDNDGIRKVLREGNAFMNTTLTLTLPDGAYEWGVQTVNAALRGSVFAQGGKLAVGDQSNIQGIKSAATAGAIYTVDGRQLSAAQKGLNIVRSGTSFQKVIVK
ncbi:MAG: VCBS repeat-containing protein [Bacteroidaceae bacterium]|nr:VCBS repeat-containing protein [Bacteroidaceae bacterium]